MASPKPALTRVLLVEPDERAATRLVCGLGSSGVAGTHAASVSEAQSALRSGNFDAVVLGHQPGGADRIASCATLHPDVASPPLLLLDASADDREMELLPSHMRPAALLPRPVDEEKLAHALETVLRAEDAEPEEGSDWGGLSLPELLVNLRDAGETGTLEIRSDGVCTTLYLDEGNPAFAEGGSLRETLGRMLLRRGEISEGEFVRVIDRMTQRLVESEPLRMGEALIELGLLEPAEVYQALRDQVREKIVACFQWRSFTASFHTLAVLPEGMSTFDTPPLEALIAEGVRTHYGPERVDRLLREYWTHVPKAAAPQSELAERFQLSGPEQRFLHALDGRRSLDVLRSEENLDPEAAGQLLAALVVTRAVRLTDPNSRDEPVARAVAGASPASSSAIRHTASPPEPARAVAQVKPGESRARLEAERLFREGQTLLATEDYEQAAQRLADAVRLQSREPEYAMLEAWASYLARRVEATLARAKARACAQRMAQLDPRSARPHSILGRLALDEHLLEQAARGFEAALDRDPTDADAARGLRGIESSAPRG
jgi:DNA-binding response OmpR family regulator/tetratricopeptide (TPR) repeat protein